MKSLYNKISESLLDDENEILNKDFININDLFKYNQFNKCFNRLKEYLIGFGGKIRNKEFKKREKDGLYVQFWKTNDSYSNGIRFEVLINNNVKYDMHLWKDKVDLKVNADREYNDDLTTICVNDNQSIANITVIYLPITNIVKEFINKLFKKANSINSNIPERISESLLDDEASVIDKDVITDKWLKDNFKGRKYTFNNGILNYDKESDPFFRLQINEQSPVPATVKEINNVPSMRIYYRFNYIDLDDIPQINGTTEFIVQGSINKDLYITYWSQNIGDNTLRIKNPYSKDEDIYMLLSNQSINKIIDICKLIRDHTDDIMQGIRNGYYFSVSNTWTGPLIQQCKAAIILKCKWMKKSWFKKSVYAWEDKLKKDPDYSKDYTEDDLKELLKCKNSKLIKFESLLDDEEMIINKPLLTFNDLNEGDSFYLIFKNDPNNTVIRDKIAGIYIGVDDIIFKLKKLSSYNFYIEKENMSKTMYNSYNTLFFTTKAEADAYVKCISESLLEPEENILNKDFSFNDIRTFDMAKKNFYYALKSLGAIEIDSLGTEEPEGLYVQFYKLKDGTSGLNINRHIINDCSEINIKKEKYKISVTNYENVGMDDLQDWVTPSNHFESTIVHILYLKDIDKASELLDNIYKQITEIKYNESLLDDEDNIINKKIYKKFKDLKVGDKLYYFHIYRSDGVKHDIVKAVKEKSNNEILIRYEISFARLDRNKSAGDDGGLYIYATNKEECEELYKRRKEFR